MCRHNRLDAHRVSFLRNIILRNKETHICLDRTLGQLNAMCLLLESDARLIETDMSVVSKAKQLHIYAADRVDDLIVCIACLFAVRLRAIRQEGTVAVDIDLAE